MDLTKTNKNKEKDKENNIFVLTAQIMCAIITIVSNKINLKGDTEHGKRI